MRKTYISSDFVCKLDTFVKTKDIYHLLLTELKFY